MKLALICPDDLSTLIFCKSFAEALKDSPGTEIVTVGQVGDYAAELLQLGTRHIDVPMARFVNPLRDIRYFARLYGLCRREKFDAVITFTTKPNIYGTTAAKLAGTPVVTMAVRGMGRVFNDPTSLKDHVLYFVTSAMYRLATSMTDRVWFTHRGDLDFMVSRKFIPLDETILTTNAINLHDFSVEATDGGRLTALRDELGLRDGDRTIIMVARMIWPKGVREFAEAAKLLYRDHPHYRFLLVAPLEPESPSAVPESYVREFEKISNLQWLGFRKDVRDLYAISDLSVLPSYYKEGGYPRALLEAMGFAKPVIAADTAECRGPVDDGKNGFLVPPRDSQALADKIVGILGDDRIRESFGLCSLNRVRTMFDDRVVVRQVLDALHLNHSPS